MASSLCKFSITIAATPHVSHGGGRTPRSSSSAVSTTSRRSYFLCKSSQPTNKPGGGGEKKSSSWAERLCGDVLKAGMQARESLSPKQKGDWKDVTLMSFSFAVYVYISQKLVCTYCAWLSMINHQ